MAQRKAVADRPDEAVDDALRELIALANAFVGRVWAHFQARVAEFNLSVTDAKALLSLPPDRGLSMRELASRLEVNPSNVTLVVSRLEARGLAVRQGTIDRRVKTVRLTANGQEVLRNLEARLAEDHPAVSGLTPAQRETLRRILAQMNR